MSALVVGSAESAATAKPGPRPVGGPRAPAARTQTRGMQPLPPEVQERTGPQWAHATAWGILQKGEN